MKLFMMWSCLHHNNLVQPFYYQAGFSMSTAQTDGMSYFEDKKKTIEGSEGPFFLTWSFLGLMEGLSCQIITQIHNSFE